MKYNLVDENIRLRKLIDEHVCCIEDLEKIAEIMDYGICSEQIIDAVLKYLPYSTYARDILTRKTIVKLRYF